MDAPLYRSVCAPLSTNHGYKRELVASGLRSSQNNGGVHMESSSEAEDDEDTSSDSTSAEEDDSEEPETPSVYGYMRCPPSSDVHQVNQAVIPNWTFISERTPEIRSIRSSDTASVTSSKRSSASKNKATTGSGIIDALFSPAVKNGQYVHVRKRPPLSSTLSSTPSKSRSKSDTSVIDARKQKSSAASVKEASTKERRKKSKSDQDNMKLPGFSSIFRTTQSPKSSKSKPAKTVSCISCLDDMPEKKAAHLKCDHHMCRSCMKRVFELSTTDPSLMPPKCCDDNEIELRHVEALFDSKFKVLWNRKHAEYLTKHRLYCPKKGCGAWIKPKNIEQDRATGRKVGTCSKCKTKVCKKCNLKWHPTRECENDKDTKQVLDMAKEREGWQRCYRCKAVVELDSGCNHMTCRCGAQFCMLCGRKWRDPMCQVECPLFSIPLDTDPFVEVIEVDDDAWFVPPRPPARRRRGQENGQDRNMNDALRALEEEFGVQQPVRHPRRERQRATINGDDFDEQLARELQDAEFDFARRPE